MARGRPKGSKNKNSKTGLPVKASFAKVYAPDTNETDDQIDTRIRERFNVMHIMAGATCVGKNRAMIISGPPGLGKSFGVGKICDKLAEKGFQSSHIQGFVRPTGLYKALYENKEKNQVLILDDADSVFADEATLNMLKIACDTTRTRNISWLAETRMEDELGEKIPRHFEFNGSVIFITNLDFDEMIARGSRLAPHLEALISRCHYLDLALKSKRDYLIRIQQVLKQGMLEDMGIHEDDQAEIVKYLETNSDKLRELSLRMVLKLANLIKMNRNTWKTIADITCRR